MKLVPIFRGRVEAGKISMLDREGFASQLANLEGKEVELVLRRYKQRRSEKQNAYFHGVVCPLISEHTGYEPEEVKEILKQMFLLVDDGKHPHARPTSSLNTAEFAEFTEQCRRWAASELGVSIPDPGVIE